ncbi:MAG: hypothetical protein PHE49_09600 [bacterium]|nr:hypothetical protein [bacterium]
MTCLIFSLQGNPYDPLDSGKLFERITEVAIKNFIDGESLLTGFPSGGISVENIANKLKETPISELPTHAKDKGVDVVAWKHFGDERSSQIILLIQCAAGDNWKEKLRDISLYAWCQYIHFACCPIKGFSMPRVVSNIPALLNEFSAEAGLILDRPRIYRNTVNATIDPTLRGDLKIWCDTRIEEMMQ